MKPFFRRRVRGFSLVEMLVAATVLLLVVFLITQITDGTMKSVALGSRHLDADTQARMVFNRLAVDFSHMLKRSDLDFTPFKQPASELPSGYDGADGSPVGFPANPQPGNDRMAFYSETAGYFSGTPRPTGTQRSPVSLVAWRMGEDQESGRPALLRLGRGLGWEPASSGLWDSVAFLPFTIAGKWSDVFSDTGETKTVGDQVFRMEYVYLLKARGSQPARLSLVPWHADRPPFVAGFRDVAAIVVTLALLDTSSRQMVNEFTALTAALPDAQEDASGQVGNVAERWKQIVQAPGFAASVGLPAAAAGSVRIYERHFDLRTQP